MKPFDVFLEHCELFSKNNTLRFPDVADDDEAEIKDQHKMADAKDTTDKLDQDNLLKPYRFKKVDFLNGTLSPKVFASIHAKTKSAKNNLDDLLKSSIEPMSASYKGKNKSMVGRHSATVKNVKFDNSRPRDLLDSKEDLEEIMESEKLSGDTDFWPDKSEAASECSNDQPPTTEEKQKLCANQLKFFESAMSKDLEPEKCDDDGKYLTHQLYKEVKRRMFVEFLFIDGKVHFLVKTWRTLFQPQKGNKAF